ncbi:MAG: hypothetical protein HN869_07260 [Verrucomicrobia bacterium]|jgi:hypothetical protein|nr:hypothetical protein [Verrucomicrobiota bacterium]
MAAQKKGYGFLITALVILLLGGGLTIFLGISAFNSGKEFTENLEGGESFITPETFSYTSKENKEVTIWILGDEDIDLNEIEIEFTDLSTGITNKASKPNGTNHVNSQYHLADFRVEKGRTYQVTAKGATNGSTILISHVSSDAIVPTLGKVFGAFGVAGVTFILTLIFGIIGLVKYLDSQKTKPHQSPPPLS